MKYGSHKGENSLKIALVFLLLVFLWPVQVQAVNVLFEYRDRTYLSRDVVFERNRMVTADGFLDVHILTVPLNDPYITVAPVESQRELGLRETTSNLLTSVGAIAGTNADFFGMIGTHSLAFGPVIANGELMSITANYNQGYDEFAAFFLDENNIPMLRYIRPRVWFTVNGLEKIRVNAVNKVHVLYNPVIITRNGMTDTVRISERFPGARKVVIENGVVLGTFAHPVMVPENGFVVAMDEARFNRYRPEFWVGMVASFEVFSDLGRDLSEIQSAVGGGGLILRHGQVVHDTGTAIPGRHPRSALGITGDWQHLILMTVDGRGHSIGATHDDMAALLRRYGASDAMHLDGGGSATMVAQVAGRHTPLQVVNRVSDGGQRAVMNAVGVFDRSSPGFATELVIMPYDRNVARGGALPLFAYGLDPYRHRIPVDQQSIHFSAYIVGADGQVWPSTGTWQGNTYFPDRPGAVLIRARYGTLESSATFLVQDISALQFTSRPIVTRDHMSVPFWINGITTGGTAVNMTAERGYVQFTVSPPDLGFVLNHVFVPERPGRGYITAFMGGVQASLPVKVASPYEELDPFYFDAYMPVGPAFIDPIRTAMTAVTPGYAFDFNITLPGHGRIGYFSRQEGPAAVVGMSAAGGGIFSTDRSQWGRFLPDINMMFPNFVIIQMDFNPLRMHSADERELFHQALRTQQEMGRVVFVISNAEHAPSFQIRDGIRYIDLGNAGYDSTVWFRAIEGQIWYDF